MRSCAKCGFVWNAAFDPNLVSYSTAYENCQSGSDHFRDHLEKRIARIAQSLPPGRPAVIVEVGCGQGSFLAQLVEFLGSTRVRAAYGFDPAWRGTDGGGPAGTALFRRYFDRKAVEGLELSPDIIISRHTIEHVSDPIEFLSAVRAAILPGQSCKLYLETPCNRWIQEHAALQDYFYEHCSIFDVASLSWALHSVGFLPTRLERVFGEQYLWAEAETLASGPSNLAIHESRFKRIWTERLIDAGRKGRTSVWGAGAKGATFLLLVDESSRLVHSVIDVNPGKQGRFLPGTGHPIIAPSEAATNGIETVVVMNPNYAEEIRQAARSLNWEVPCAR
jgi:C-methyltransferase C-terminal domain/Methyltransferase domain